MNITAHTIISLVASGVRSMIAVPPPESLYSHRPRNPVRTGLQGNLALRIGWRGGSMNNVTSRHTGMCTSQGELVMNRIR